MFDIFGKINELKSSFETLKKNSTEKKIEFTDELKRIKISTNGKKDIIELDWDNEFEQLSKNEKTKLLKATLEKALKESELYMLEEVKKIVPNIPGLNLF